MIVFTSIITLTIAQNPSVDILESKQTVKGGDTIIFTCTLLNPVSGGVLVWTHFRDGTMQPELYSSKKVLPRIEVTEYVVSDMTTVSSLSIFNATSDDTGLTSCRYTYYDSVGNKTIQSVASICVTPRPDPPMCLTNGKYELLCSAAVSACPEDVTLRWFDSDTMEELYGIVTVNGGSTENVLATNNETNTYLCELKSTVHEDVHLNCSIDRSPNEMVTQLHEQTPIVLTQSQPTQPTSVSGSSSSYFKTTANTNTSPISSKFFTRYLTSGIHSTSKDTPVSMVKGYTRTFIIGIGFAGAGGMFILFIIVVVIVIVYKKICKKRQSDAEFAVKFEGNNANIQLKREDTNQDKSNSHNYTETSGEDKIPIYSKPIKNKLVLEGSSNQAVESDTIHAVQKSSHVQEGAGTDHNLNKSNGLDQTQIYSTLNEVDNQLEQSDANYAQVSDEIKMVSESATAVGGHSRPDLNMKSSNKDSNPYASVQDTDRPQMKLPEHESANEYAYAYTGLKVPDHNLDTNADSGDNGKVEESVNGPHYFVLEKDSNKNDEDQNKFMPVSDKLKENNTIDVKSDANQEIRIELDQEPTQSPHEYAYACFGPNGRSIIHISAKNETTTNEDDEDDDSIMIENSIYER